MTVVPIIVPGQVVVVTTSGVAVELVWPGAGGEAATLSLVSVISVIVMREELSPGYHSTHSLTLLPGHDGAELRHQAVAPVTQLIDVEVVAVSRLSCRCSALGGCALGGGSRSGC